jgi:hypothetical protein
MVFLDRTFWAAVNGSQPGRVPVFPLVRALAREARTPFEHALLATDSADEAVAFVADCNSHAAGRVRIADVRLRAPGRGIPMAERKDLDSGG